MLFQSAKRISERVDGNGSRCNDDACSKQFNRQRHEGDGAMLARLDYENLIQVNHRGGRRNRHEPPQCKPFNQEADRDGRGLGRREDRY